MKAFLNFKGNLPIVRNGVKFELIPLSMEKGSKGVYPGIDSKSFELEKFISFKAKNIETSKDATLRMMSFNSFVVDAINDVCMATWKETVKATEKEYDAKDKASKPTIEVNEDTFNAYVKSFTESLNGFFNGETKQRERNSSYYAKEASELAKAYSKETDKEKKAKLRLLAAEAQKMSKTLREQEEKAMDDVLKDILE